MQISVVSLQRVMMGISRLKIIVEFFPGVSVGWNVMEEDFWKDSKVSGVISNPKPRVSYGVNGNVNEYW